MLTVSTDLAYCVIFGCQVLGEMMHISSQYLANEEKAVVAMSKMEAEASGLGIDLIASMDANNTSKEKIQALSEQLNAEKLLEKPKDEQLAVAN